MTCRRIARARAGARTRRARWRRSRGRCATWTTWWRCCGGRWPPLPAPGTGPSPSARAAPTGTMSCDHITAASWC